MKSFFYLNTFLLLNECNNNKISDYDNCYRNVIDDTNESNNNDVDDYDDDDNANNNNNNNDNNNNNVPLQPLYDSVFAFLQGLK